MKILKSSKKFQSYTWKSTKSIILNQLTTVCVFAEFISPLFGCCYFSNFSGFSICIFKQKEGFKSN